MKKGREWGLGEYIDINNTYRLYLPLDESLNIDMHRDLVSKFFNLIHGLDLSFKLILKIDETGSSFYFSDLSDSRLLKTVYRNLTDMNIIKTIIEFEKPDIIYSSYQKNKKNFLGPKTDFVDFFEYILSYRNRISKSAILLIIDIKGINIPFRIDYKGLAFKFKINILAKGDFLELNNFISLVSNYWTNDNSYLKFKKIKNPKNLKKGGCIVNDRNVVLTMPYPGKVLENAGIVSKFVSRNRLDNILKSIVVGKGLLTGKNNMLTIYEKDGQSTLLIGETGSGKSTTLLSTFFELINENRPLILIDPAGDTAKEVIKRIDMDQIKRVIYISTVETPVSMNLLDIPDGMNRHLAVSRIAEDTIQVLKNVSEAETGISGGLVGSKIEEIVRNSISGLVNIKGSTLLDISYIITKPGVRKHLKKISKDPEFIDFLNDLDTFSNDDVSSTRRTLSFLKTNQVLKSIMCSRAPLFNIADAIKKNMIIIVNGERGKVGERVSTFILSSIISMIWISIQEKNEKNSIFLFCDEFQDYINSSFEDMLILGRKENLNLFMATTHLSTIPVNVRESIMANTKNFILFKLSPSDSRDFAEKFSIDKKDLMNLSTGIAYFKTTNVSELCELKQSIPDEKNNESSIIEKSKSYISSYNTISPVLDIHDEAISLFLDIQLLKYLHISCNVSNIVSLREKIPQETKFLYEDDLSFIKEILERLSMEKIIRFENNEIKINDYWRMITANETHRKLIEKMLSLGLILRIEKTDPLIFISIPYSHDSFNPLNKNYFRIGIETEADITIKNDSNNCKNCYSFDEFLKLSIENDLIDKIMGICIGSTDDEVLITTSHRIAIALRKIDESVDVKYGPDLERIIRKILIENNYARDGERISINNTRVRTIVIDLKEARKKFKKIEMDIDLKIK